MVAWGLLRPPLRLSEIIFLILSCWPSVLKLSNVKYLDDAKLDKTKKLNMKDTVFGSVRFVLEVLACLGVFDRVLGGMRNKKREKDFYHSFEMSLIIGVIIIKVRFC